LLLLHFVCSALKVDLLCSLFLDTYPTSEDLSLVRAFIACPLTLDDKYCMMRVGDILRRNKDRGVELSALAEAMGQLARIGQELLREEVVRDPAWRNIPIAREITVAKDIAQRAPWELIQVRKLLLIRNRLCCFNRG
jgi:hypothetical protein